jgi:CBS domain-containing protein
MTSPVVTISPDTDIGQVISVLSHSGKNHIPVVEGNEIIGLITAADVIRVLATLKLVAKAVPDDDV